MKCGVDPFIQSILDAHKLSPVPVKSGFEFGALLDAVEKRAVELAFQVGGGDTTCCQLRLTLEEEFSEELVKEMVSRITSENEIS